VLNNTSSEYETTKTTTKPTTKTTTDMCRTMKRSGDTHNLPLAEDTDDDADISIEKHFSSMKKWM
jgi:hypothetical protein